jgi:hypothetical protein
VAVAVPADEFLVWAASVGVGFDPRYPHSDWLVLLAPDSHSRFWEMPEYPYAIPDFLETAVNALDPWEIGYLWPRDARWCTATDCLANEAVRDVIWRGAGMPLGLDCAARVGRDERSEVVAVLFAALALGGDGCSDVFFVPDHARQIVYSGHHDVLHVDCVDEARMLEFVRDMRSAGIDLPTEPPDATFKRPSWMPPPEAGPA